MPSTAAPKHVTSSTGTVSSQPVSKAKPVDPTTAAQLQKIKQQIQNISAKLKSLRTERERLESEGTEEQHKKAMSILEQEQMLERQHKEALFQQKQILNKQKNVAVGAPVVVLDVDGTGIVTLSFTCYRKKNVYIKQAFTK